LEDYEDCDEKCLEAREEFCQWCCAEYLAHEPCPECDCSEIIDELLDEEDLFFYDGDEELWDWDEEDEEV
jgi:hypothetical protein